MSSLEDKGLVGRTRRARVPRPAIERLKAKLALNPETGCDVWTGALDRKGYARIAVGGHRNNMAHRVAFTAARGTIPPGMTLDHLCRNKACCNPDHLEVVTAAENNRRKAHPTQCPWGHEVTAANTYFSAAGHRHCRVCDRIRKVKKRRLSAEFRARQALTVQVSGGA